MTRPYFQLFAVGVFAVIALTPAILKGQQSPRQLFERARILEEANQDLVQAIRLYERAAAEAKGDRALGAQSLIRMADCYRKLGNAESQKIYERVVREFADQPEAGEARRRLAQLSAGLDSKMGRRLSSQLEGANSISPDGRWVATSDWTNGEGDLVVRDISTGQVRRMQVGSCGNAGKPCTFSDTPVFSPDSRRIAYTWYDDENGGASSAAPVIANLGRGQAQLRVISNEPGAKPKTLASDPGGEIWPIAWLSDGKSILVEIQLRNRTWRLAWVSAENGTVTFLESGYRFPGSGGGRRSISPDGRYIAYAAPVNDPVFIPARARRRQENRQNQNDTRIYLLRADGSRSETELIKTAGTYESPIWSPDGFHILFISDLAGSWDLWSVPVKDGRATGAPAVVIRDIGRVWPLGITRSGSYYYTRSGRSVDQISIVEMSPDGRNVRASAFPSTKSLVGINPRWSPDGKSLAFLRPDIGRPTNYLVVHSLETGEEQKHALNIGTNARLTWFHDGKSVLVPTGSGIQRFDLKSGELTPIPGTTSAPYALSPDDKIFYSLVRRPQNQMNVLAIDLSTGQPKLTPIQGFPAQEFQSLALSPDGRTLAILNRVGTEAHLSAVAVDGTNYRDLHPTVGSVNNKLLTWTHDGRAILFGQGNAVAHIMRIPADGGKPEPIGLEISEPNAHYISMHPDGSRIAFSSVAFTPSSELWVVDNIQSLLKR